MDSQDWILFKSFSEKTTVDVVAARLEDDGVPTLIKSKLVAGVVGDFRIFVPSDLLHRARWLIPEAELTDAELDYLATGDLSGSDNKEEIKENERKEDSA